MNQKNLFITGTLLGLLLMVLYRGGIPFGVTLFLALFSSVLLGGAFFGVHRKFLLEKETVMDLLFLSGSGVLLFLFVLSNFYSEAPSYGAEDFFLLASGILTFCLFSRLCFTDDSKGVLLKGLVGIGILSTIVGAFFYVTLAQARFFGTFGAIAESYNAFPNAYANFILLILPVSVYFLIQAQKKGVWIWSVLTAVLLSGLFLSLSRGAWLALLGALFLALAVLHARHTEFLKWLKKSVPTLVLVVLFVLGLQKIRGRVYEVVTIHEKATFQADEGTTSQDERITFWLDSLDMMVDRPWLGSGPGTFSFVYPEYQDSFGVISGHPHNLFLKIGVEEGIFAMITALFMCGIFFGFALFYKVNRTPYFWGLVACLLHNLVDFNLNFGSIVFLTFLFAGLVANELRDVLPWNSIFSKKMKYSPRVVLGGLMVFASAVSLLALHEFYYKVQFSKGMEALLGNQLEQADSYFESAQRQIWDESLVLNWAEVKQGLGEIEEAKRLLVEASEHVPDPRYYTLLGELSDGAEAGEWYEMALEANDQNEIQYFYNVARTVGMDTAEVRALLELYTNQLSENFHNTLLSANPKFADLLYGWLVSAVENGMERSAILEEYEVYLEVWEEQKNEFESLYKVQL